MATIRAFVRATNQNALGNVRFVLNISRDKKLYYTSTLQVIAEVFDNKRGQIKPRVSFPDKERRIFNAKVDELRDVILKAWENRPDGVNPTSLWLKNEVERILSGEECEVSDFFADYADFLRYKRYEGKIEEHYIGLERILRRFEEYRAVTRRPFAWSYSATHIDLADFEAYMRDEWQYWGRFPTIYEGVREIKPRGRNTIINMMTKFRVFALWAVKVGKTVINPFSGYEIKAQVYGRPYYLSIEERDAVYNLDLSHRPQLAIQRDIFIFQCLVGCRVSDLMRLTRGNINNGSIEYVAKKTSQERAEYVSVPMTPKVVEILSRYESYNGMTLFPHISPQRYNDDIKVILRLAGIDRVVTVINPITQLEEQRPIYEIASSHLARRTFIGNMYKYVKDPNIIGSMSGHVEGSKAFSRYRDIDDDIKRDALKGIE